MVLFSCTKIDKMHKKSIICEQYSLVKKSLVKTFNFLPLFVNFVKFGD